MKTRIILTALVATVFAACNNSKNIQSKIAGIYVSSSGSDYSVAEDTLTISQDKDNVFSIIHKTGYRVIREGKLLPKRFKKEQLNAVYDEKLNVLDEITTGRMIIIDSDNRLLKVNKATYRKL